MRRLSPCLALSIAVAHFACGEDGTSTDAADVADAATFEDAFEADVTPSSDANGTIDATEAPDASEPIDGGERTDLGPALEPILFVHGIGGTTADFDVMKARLIADGWPDDHLFAIQFADPRWDCNIDNAAVIRDEAARARQLTGAARVDLVAHSMGTVSSKYYMKTLGGASEVGTFVTLGGLHYGNPSACLNPLPVCVWQELCPTNPYLSELNADPAAPGPARWVSICSRSDTSAPLSTCHFDAAENIEFDGIDHAGTNGLLEHPDVYPELLRVLAY